MHILVVDDDPAQLKLLQFMLSDAGHGVAAVPSAEAALSYHETPPDLYLLDVALPGLDGFSLCRQLRATHPRGAIMFLSAHGGLDDRVRGLELGADDYVVKPYAPAELLARIQAVHRPRREASTNVATDQVQVGPFELQFSNLTLVLHEPQGLRRVRLTPTEMRLLRCLMTNAGQAMMRETLLSSIWGYSESGTAGQVIDVYIRRLRKKIEADPSDPQLIQSVKGAGYRFTVSDTAIFTAPNGGGSLPPADYLARPVPERN